MVLLFVRKSGRQAGRQGERDDPSRKRPARAACPSMCQNPAQQRPSRVDPEEPMKERKKKQTPSTPPPPPAAHPLLTHTSYIIHHYTTYEYTIHPCYYPGTFLYMETRSLWQWLSGSPPTPSEHHWNRIVTREQHRRMADMTDEEEPEHQYRHNIY